MVTKALDMDEITSSKKLEESISVVILDLLLIYSLIHVFIISKIFMVPSLHASHISGKGDSAVQKSNVMLLP